MQNRHRFFVFVGVRLLAAAALLGLGACAGGPPVAPMQAVGSTTVSDAGLKTNAAGLPSLAPMVKRVAPAVVNISAEGRVKVAANPLLNDPFFRRFFDLPERLQQPQEQLTESLGSGVIIDADQGYVVTNSHVIEQADAIQVTLSDGRIFNAEIVGSDPETDVAIIQIPARRLIALPLADSDRLEVGDFVVAIGNPFGLGQTVTSGIVSALRRSGLGIKGYEDFIQTDASINPGNSGGALVDLSGRLVGINTAILAPGGGNIGISFAIPSNMVRTLSDQFLQFGGIDRGQLGVAVSDLSPQGALITEVLPQSAAASAGIKKGDVVVAVNGKTVRSAAALRTAIGLLRVGEKVAVELVRDGKPLSLTARVGQRSAAAANAEGQ